MEEASYILDALDSGPRFRAGLDLPAGFEIPGWALDARDPARPVRVELMVAGHALAAATTGGDRPDIERFAPGANPGFRLDLREGDPAAMLAALRAIATLPDGALPASLRVEGAGELPSWACPGVTAEALRRTLLALPAACLLPPRPEEAPAPDGRSLLGLLAGEALLFDEERRLAERPQARRVERSELSAAFEDWLRSGEAPAHPSLLHAYPPADSMLRGEVALAEGRLEAARDALSLAAARLLDEPAAAAPGATLGAALAALEAGRLAADGWRERLLARAAFFLACAQEMPLAADLALARLQPVLERLHHAGSGGPSRLADLQWWARLAPVLLGTRPPGGLARPLCLSAWQAAPPGRRAAHPMPPTGPLRRLLLLAWAAEAMGEGNEEEALAAALQAFRDLLALRERPWRRALDAPMQALFAPGPVDRRAFAACLAAIGEAGFGSRRALAIHGFLRAMGLAEAPDRRIAPPEEPARPPLEVAFLVGALEGESLRYRVVNLVAALEAKGVAATTMLPEEAAELHRHCGALRTLVVFRAPHGPMLADAIRAARRLGAQVVFDVDDLTFDPALAPEMKSLQAMTAEEREGAMTGLRLYREALLLADAVTGSTAAIADAARALGRPAWVVPNTHGPFERLIAARTPEARAPGTVTLGYFSGTWTHGADFRQMEAPLLAALRRHPQLRLLVAGSLRLGPEWEAVAAQVERAPLLPHPRMLALHGRVDVALAPLEHGLRFTEAKSELKVFEPALCAIPAIASPTAPYAAAITHGEDGLLAATEAEWAAALEAVATDAPLRRRLGEAARARSLRQFGEHAAAEAWLRARDGWEAMTPRRLSLLLALPAGEPAAEALRIGEGLALLGHRVALLEAPAAGTRTALPVAPRAAALAAPLLLGADAAGLEALARLGGGTLLHLALEDEAARHPLGWERLRAEAAQALPLPRIARGAALAARLGAARLDPAPDRRRFHPRGETHRARTLVAFRTDPKDPARCHALGLAALAQLQAQQPAVEIAILGLPPAPPREPWEEAPAPLPPGMEEMRGWEDWLARARLYSAATVGLCFAPGGPDEALFEMLCCGLPVVQARTPLAGEGLTLLAEPSPEALAAALAALLEGAAAREAQAATALRALDAMPGPVGQARQMEEWLLSLPS